METEKIEDAIQQGIIQGVKQQLSNSYGPISKMVSDLIIERAQDLIAEGVAQAFSDHSFRGKVKADIAEVVGKSLVKRFGGDIERHVNALKSDPKTRCQIVDALEKIAAQDPNPVQSVQGDTPHQES